MEDFERPPNPARGEVRSTLADDLLHGAGQIADFVYGDPKQRRRVYYLVEKSHIPHFRLGAILCARKSRLIQWIEEQEARSTDGAGK